jgi:hypothetical protein
MRIIDRTDKSDKPKCNYCGIDAPEHGFDSKRVIHRASNPTTGKAEVVTSVFTVCKGTPCGGHLQMAYEG